MPSDEELARAARFGRRFALAGRDVTECPYDVNGTPDQQILARRFIRAYIAVDPKATAASVAA